MHYILVPLLICITSAHHYYHIHEDELYYSKTDEGPRIVRHSFFMQNFRLGYKLKLFCEAHGKPLPDLRWYKDGVEIPGRGEVRIRNQVSNSSIASHLDIDPARMRDAGEYECVANNTYGYHLQHIRAQIRL
uniref:Ig-like domain-containing protein n=1 Tax=Haemonchus contortus TaxID=6289 RepID=A0A7I4XY01_HAECO